MGNEGQSKPLSKVQKVLIFMSLLMFIFGLGFLLYRLLFNERSQINSITDTPKKLTIEPPSMPKEYVYEKAKKRDNRSIGQKFLEEGTAISEKLMRPKQAAVHEESQDVVLGLYKGMVNHSELAHERVKEVMPYGRLIPCETVITIDSCETGTPIIGYVTEDVCHNGNLYIPAGTEVHGHSTGDFIRDRIQANGEWVFVWRNLGKNMNKELRLQGTALDRDQAMKDNFYGITDGSIGIRGEIIENNQFKETKMLLSKFVAGLSRGLVVKEKQEGINGTSVVFSDKLVKNSLLSGTHDILDLYSDRLMQEIASNKPFVRIPTGKQFYIYVTQSFN